VAAAAAGMEKPTTEEVGRAFLVGVDEGPEVLDDGCKRDAHDFFRGCWVGAGAAAGAGGGPGVCASASVGIGTRGAGAGDKSWDRDTDTAGELKTDVLCASSPFAGVEPTEVFEVTGELGRVCESVSVTADEGTVDVAVDEDKGDVRDCASGGVWGTMEMPSLSESSCDAATGVGRYFECRGGEGGGV
jgi:hypothetical protein